MKITNLIYFVLSFVLISITISCSSQKAKQKPDNQNIADLVLKTVADDNIPGMIAAIVDSNGIRQIESAGLRNKNTSEQITNNDLFHLGSCTKAMTSTLFATLVANNKIKWETTIIDVFPELKNTIHQNYHKVTLHQLATHRAGIQTNAENWWVHQDVEIKERRLSILKENLKTQSRFKSGEYNYSNLGYMVAASMVERITGQSWETLTKNLLFKPLGMNSAGFGPPGATNKIDQPWGHIKNAGQWRPIQEDNAEALGPAGTVHCTIEDWAKFISLFLKKDNSIILDRNQLNKLIDPIGDYACGWIVVQREWANGKTFTHSGSNTMWHVTVWIAPEINRAYLVGINSHDKNSEKICDKMIGKLIGINQDFQ